MLNTPPAQSQTISDQRREIFIRSRWFACHLVLEAANLRNVVDQATYSSFLRFAEPVEKVKQREDFRELLIYLSWCALERLKAEMEGNDSAQKDHAFLDYVASLAIALERALAPEERIFEALEGYRLIEYNEEFDEFWGIDEELGETDEEVDEQLKLHYTPERYYAFRVAKIYEKRDLNIVIRNSELFRRLAMELYEPAFHKIATAQQERDLRIDSENVPRNLYQRDVITRIRRGFANSQVKKILNSLSEFESKYNCTAFAIVRKQVEFRIISQRKQFTDFAQKNGDEEMRKKILSIVNTVAGDHVESGCYHVTHGVLNPFGPGKEFLQIYYDSADELVRLGSVEKDFAEAQKSALRQNIKIAAPQALRAK